MNMNFFTLPVLAVIASNLYPLVMTALGYWDATQVVTLYWTESAVVAFYNVLATLCASAPAKKMYKGNVTLGALNSVDSAQMLPRLLEDLGIMGRLLLAVVSLVPFALIMTITGLMIYSLYLMMDSDTQVERLLLSVKWGTLALFLSHGVAFVQDYLRKGVFRNTRPEDLWQKPYSRLAVMQVAIIMGGYAVTFFHVSPMMIAFVVAKVILELYPEGGYFHPGAEKKKAPAGRASKWADTLGLIAVIAAALFYRIFSPGEKGGAPQKADKAGRGR